MLQKRNHLYIKNLILGSLSLSLVCSQTITLAEPIVPATDGTGTLVEINGNEFNITGGKISGDRANLFHSFQEFGLKAGETANFISSPEINNILVRVTGGNASIINGLIQVTGSNSNLFLMNPAGIVFGPNASLNIPADFIATTATGIGFNSGWFNAAGINQYDQLIGTPSVFQFDGNGGIVNFGNLNLSAGHQLGLLGSTVLNFGNLSAPGGNIIITAVPGENLVNLSQPGHLLSLEINPTSLETITAVNLPELLTGGEVSNANQVIVHDDGTIQLTGSEIRVPTDAGVALVSGNIDVSNNATAGTVAVLGEKVALVDANITANGNNGGGNVFIGGEFQGQGKLPNAAQNFVSPNTVISADAVDNGNGGEVIIWADETTRFHGNISANGGIDGGNGGLVEVSGKQDLSFRGEVDTRAAQGSGGTLLLDPENIVIVNGNGGAYDAELTGDGQIFAADGSGDFTISETVLEGISGNIILEANNDITIDDLADNNLDLKNGLGASVTFTADADNNGSGNFVMNDPGDWICTQGGGMGALSISGVNIDVGTLYTTTPNDGNGGYISLTTHNGNITTQDLRSNSYGAGRGGDITLTVNGSGNIEVKSLLAGSSTGDGGNISLTTENGDITTKDHFWSSAYGAGRGGDITLSTGSGIITTTGDLYAHSESGDGGNISLTADEIDLGGSLFSSDPGILLLQPATTTQSIEIGGSITSDNLDLTATELAYIQDGFSAINIGRSDGSGTINIDTNGFSPTDPVTARSPNGQIIVNGSITATDNASVTLNGATTLNADIATNNQNITITNNTMLGADASLNSGNGNINIQGTIDGAKSLTLNAGTGNININDAIGSSTPLSSLTTKGVTTIDGHVTTTGTQTYNSDVNFVNSNPQITAGELDLSGKISGIGNLVIQPESPDQAIELGGNNFSTALDLTEAELQLINEFDAVIIGRLGDSGTINVAGGINLINQNFALTIQGGQLTFNNGITLGENGVLTLNTGSVTSPSSGTDIAIA